MEPLLHWQRLDRPPSALSHPPNAPEHRYWAGNRTGDTSEVTSCDQIFRLLAPSSQGRQGAASPSRRNRRKSQMRPAGSAFSERVPLTRSVEHRPSHPLFGHSPQPYTVANPTLLRPRPMSPGAAFIGMRYSIREVMVCAENLQKMKFVLSNSGALSGITDGGRKTHTAGCCTHGASPVCGLHQ